MPQSLAKIIVHTVFFTKERRPFLRDRALREELRRYLGGILSHLDCQPNPGGGSNTPSWSHDGKVLCSCRLPGSKVAWEFQPQRPDTDHFNRDFNPELARGGAEICRIDPGDRSVTRLTRPGELVWDFRQSESPDGRQIVFCRARTGDSPAIWVMNADGSNPRELAKGLDNRGTDHPRWVPQAA